MLEIAWGPDLRLESQMQQLGCPFDIRTIPLSRVDLEWTKNNQARLGDIRVHEHLVEDYAVGLQNKDTFPRTAVIPLTTGKFGGVSGLHRFYGVRKVAQDDNTLPSRVRIPVYVILDQREWVRELLIRSPNRHHGQRQPADEALRHCLQMIADHKRPVDEMALHFQLKPSVIQTALDAERARGLLAAANVDHYEQIGLPTMRELARLYDQPNALVKVGHLCATFGLSAKATHDIIREILADTRKASVARIVKRYETLFTKSLEVQDASEEKGKVVRTKTVTNPFTNPLLAFVRALDRGNAGNAFVTLPLVSENPKLEFEALEERWKYICKRFKPMMALAKKQVAANKTSSAMGTSRKAPPSNPKLMK